MHASPTSDAGPLFEMDPTGRFTNRARDYALFRPSYPPEAISSIISGLIPGGLVCADIGAGTGISSRLLADRGLHVFAIEPNASMRDSAQPHPRVDFRAGSAEATGLKTASADLVVCAQAFHWFDPEKALAEFHRILRPGGRVCLMWNDRDTHDPLTSEYGRLILRTSNYHPAAEERGMSAEALDHSPLFTNMRLRLFRYEQTLTLQGLIGRAHSASYVPQIGQLHDNLVEALTNAFNRFADAKGTVRLAYTTRVHLAESIAS